MRLCIAAAVTLFMFAGSVDAHPPRLYVGGSFQRIWTSEVEYPDPWDDTPEPWITYSGIGTQIEGGWSGDFWSVYLASRYDAGSHSWHNSTSSHWTAERFILGARLRVSDHDPNPVKPVLGTGLSLGWAKRGHEDEHGSKVSASYSEAGLGWLGETGIMIRVQKPLMISLLLRFEDMGLQLERWDYEDRTRTVQQVSLSLGASYRLMAAASSQDK